ncbi:Fic family protein [Amorphus coralli]|uniref:Fic family protein n=1 Tax=Amorphus coralli TaxID=340680 RepID=UPI0003760CEE|nr:Fic family protein [Amorphus coralli]
MDKSDFIAPETGSLVPTLSRQLAFVPAPLPPRIDLAAVALPLMTAMGSLGELKGACRRLQNPYILVRPLQRNEALTSSAMEGTYTTDDHLLLAEAGLDSASDESTREIVNYIHALQTSLGLLGTLPISHRLIRKSHEILLSGLSPQRGAQKRPGEYKRDQNWIGGPVIEKARFVPAPPAEASSCMDDLEKYINRDGREADSALIDLALVHYQIETIHPFLDGNGRVGRMLISLMAVHGGLLDMPVLYVSPALEQRKDDYIDRMYNVSTRGEWVEWITFFAEIVSQSCRETINTIDRLIALHERYRSMASDIGRSSNIASIVDLLFEIPIITIPEASEKLNVTYRAASMIVEKLVGAGILVEVLDRYPKTFLAPEILKASRPGSDR